MKLVTGSKKGISIASTKAARELRPTQAIVREAVINTILSRFELAELRVLDLYAGIGTLGLECLSSGAGHCSFVEKDPAALKMLRANLINLGFDKQSRTISRALPMALKQLDPGKPFDLIFADPPYARDDAREIIGEILTRGLLAEGAWLLWECSSRSVAKSALEKGFAGLELFKQKSYGETELFIFEQSSS